jgi:hypothetical protein
MVAACSSETSVNMHQSTRRHICYAVTLRNRCRDVLQSHIVLFLVVQCEIVLLTEHLDTEPAIVVCFASFNAIPSYPDRIVGIVC